MTRRGGVDTRAGPEAAEKHDVCRKSELPSADGVEQEVRSRGAEDRASKEEGVS